MRTAPPFPTLSIARHKPLWEETFEVELLTRLFGGGVKTREIDPHCWLRASSFKSALRFWWRAAYGHLSPSLEALREREGLLFGSPAQFEGKIEGGPGLVSVEVRQVKQAKAEPYVPPQTPREARDLAFLGAYFPAAPIGQPAAKLGDPGAVASVRLRIDPPPGAAVDEKTVDEIVTALRLWLVLGGVGSRTRKGAGAVGLRTEAAARALGVPTNSAELEALLRRVCGRGCSAHPGVFLLARTHQVLWADSRPNEVEAQRRLLEVYREARQDRAHPSDWWGATGWGRTRWPEADAIRSKVDPMSTWGPHTPSPANIGLYPRAALGLPIIFHYKQPPVEPPNQNLTAARNGGRTRISRYASPILLRPVRVWDGRHALAIPVAIFTDCTLPADALAAVERAEGAAGNAPTVAPKDLTSYSILPDAGATLDRVLQPFLEPARGFRALWP